MSALAECPYCAPDEPCAVCLGLTAAAWDETKHPRHPRGTEQGGEFAPKGVPSTFIGKQGFERGPGKVVIEGERPRLAVGEVFRRPPVDLEVAVSDWAHLREQDPGYETVNVADLVPTQDQMSAVRVKEYVQELQQDNNLGELLDSVRVVEGDDGRLYIADGHNRVAAAMEMGNEELRLPVIRPTNVERIVRTLEGLPAGEFTPDDSVKFWPRTIGAYSGFDQSAPHGPFWKALVDPSDGTELAFWFADPNGQPHHSAMQRALGEVPSDRFWYPYAGYGTTGEEEWTQSKRPAAGGAGTVRIEQEIVRRHRRDIRDGNAMLPENQQSRALAAAATVEPEDLTPEEFNEIVAEEAAKLGLYEEQLAALYRRVILKIGRAMAARFRKLAPTPLGLAAAGWKEAEHPRSPRGTREGGRWTTKLGRDVFVESKGGTVSVHQSTTPDRAFVTQYLPDIAQWPEHVPISVRLEYARLRSEALMRADQPGFDEVAAEARRLLDSIDGLVAAAPPADWNPPTVAELLAAAEEIDRATEAANKIQAASFEQIVEGILARIGISFEVRAILVQAILNGLGARAVEMIEGIRVPVARAVANSYLNGLSVPQTADAIMAAVDGLAEWQATQLARNDLVGIANGGSLTSARILKEKFPEIGLAYKEWLATDDERTRPTHNEAHGQRVPIETPFIVGGAPLAYPGDPTGPDQEVINCRCTLIYRAEPKTAVTAAGPWGLELRELTAAFDESKHPRDPGGDKGGEFIKKGTTAADEGDAWQQPFEDADWKAILALQEAGKMEEADRLISEARARKNAWTYSVRSALARGDLTIEDAVARGYHADGVEQGSAGYTWGPLPDEMYHATINAPAVLKEGLLTRDERGGKGGGLGGGSSQDISLTTSPEYAEDIAVTLRELNDVLNEKTSVQTLIDNATKGVGADRPWIDKIPEVDLKEIQKLASGDETNYEGKPFTPDELDWARYKAYTTLTGYYRQEAGGSQSTVPFNPDLNVIKAAKPDDIRVVRVKPKEGARGFHVSDAEFEWRVPTGKVLEVEDTEASTAAATREYVRYPKGTEVAPGGRGPGGGRFAPVDGVGAEDEELAAEALDELEHRDMLKPKPLPGEWTGPPIEPRQDKVKDQEMHWRATYAKKVYDEHGMTEDDYKLAAEERAGEALEARYVATRTPLDIVDDIVEDGRFKSQFETDTSRGTLNQTLRATAEQNAFGYMADFIGGPRESNEGRPIYGYMGDPRRSKLMLADPVRQYGDVEWEFKHDVRSRTTFTDADSLGGEALPSPVADPAWYSLQSPLHGVEPMPSGRGGMPGRDLLEQPLGHGRYVEAQIHGGVTLDDVAAVTLPAYVRDVVEQERSTLPEVNPLHADENRLIAAVKKLRERGITVEYVG